MSLRVHLRCKANTHRLLTSNSTCSCPLCFPFSLQEGVFEAAIVGHKVDVVHRRNVEVALGMEFHSPSNQSTSTYVFFGKEDWEPSFHAHILGVGFQFDYYMCLSKSIPHETNLKQIQKRIKSWSCEFHLITDYIPAKQRWKSYFSHTI